MQLRIVSPGFLCSLQDSGRFGYQRFGVPVAGPMDAFAFAAANRLVGNAPNAAALEFAYSGPVIALESEALVALTGVGFSLQVGENEHPAWMAVRVAAGSQVSVRAAENAGWGTLAFAGGICTPPVMGSRATYVRGGFGGLEGRLLQPGDQLPLPSIQPSTRLAGQMLPLEARPAYFLHPTLRVILGPQAEAFTEAGLASFTGSAYTLTRTADRMGYRLEGERIQHRGAADILSEGMVTGAVQVPNSGQPIVMMSDRQTTGGYAKIAAVIRADLPLLAQCQPGVSQVRFLPVSVAQAQQAYREQMARLEGIIAPLDEEYLFARG